MKAEALERKRAWMRAYYRRQVQPCECGGRRAPHAETCRRCFRPGPSWLELSEVRTATREGVTAQALAFRLGVSERTVFRWRKRAEQTMEAT